MLTTSFKVNYVTHNDDKTRYWQRFEDPFTQKIRTADSFTMNKDFSMGFFIFWSCDVN